MCEHEMEKVDELKTRVELWDCLFCDHEEQRVFYGPFGDYTVC